MMKTEFKVYVSIGGNVLWCHGTYATLSAAKRAANKEPGAALVRKITCETVYRNAKSGADPHRPIKEAISAICR